jgi:hypothetical protein
MAWTDFIGPALQLGGAYLQYDDKKDRAKDLDRQYQAYLNAREIQAQAKASQGGGRSGGGGGGNKTAAAKMMADYIKQAQARYEPYMRMANEVLPKQTELYSSALPGAQNFVGSMLSPENIADMMRYDRPVQPALPDYLFGGKK